jgi:hypothetical protein
MNIKPKQLRNTDNGRVFAYTEALSKEPNMIPHWENGVDPNQAAGLDIGASAGNQVKAAMTELETELEKAHMTIANLQTELRDRNSELARVTESNRRAMAEIAQLRSDLDDAGKTPRPQTQVDGSERQQMINAAVKAILTDKNSDELTTTGMPRVEAIEARCGIQDVNAAERNIAMAKE